tara:strand:+ start:1711 stop:1920 length:210 start_codon:yes stop_codon:yes gene_type:complete
MKYMESMKDTRNPIRNSTGCAIDGRVPLQIETTAQMRNALKAGVAMSNHKSMRAWLEAKITSEFGDFLK